jgi:HD-like signal output (HDOD) protein
MTMSSAGTSVPVRSPRSVPARSGVATRVLLLVDDPDVGVSDLAAAVGADPALASRTIALANSAYYGLSGRVGTLHYAISVLGFQTVRALAVSVAAGLHGPTAVPTGFWEQAATAATAANLVAPVFQASAPDAFCAGLLHTLGSALLHQQQPVALCLPFPANEAEQERHELEVHGIGHAELGAQVLQSWRFPARLCALIAEHHQTPTPDADELTRCLHAARSLTDLALRPDADVDDSAANATLMRLSEGTWNRLQIQPLIGRIREQSSALLEGLAAH